MIEEAKIIEIIRSYEEGRTMKLDALSISQAREEEHIKNMCASMEEMKDTLRQVDEKCDKKYCPKYVEKIVWGACAVMLLWALNQILDLIPKAHAIFVTYL